MSIAALENAVIFDGVTLSLGGTLILDDVSARVPNGSSTAILGPNGAGKTSLLRCLLRELRFSGRIQTHGPGGKLRIGYVPQKLLFDRGLPMTVLEFMAMGRARRPLWMGIGKHHRQRAAKWLHDVQADHLLHRQLGQLSGGELQRVLLALALSEDPELLVLDEPAAGVDFQGEHIFCELLEALRAERGFTQLMVSHDLATVTHHATHVICIHRRVVAEGPPHKVLTDQTLIDVFGLHMGLVNRSALAEGHAYRTDSCCGEEEEKEDA